MFHTHNIPTVTSSIYQLDEQGLTLNLLATHFLTIRCHYTFTRWTFKSAQKNTSVHRMDVHPEYWLKLVVAVSGSGAACPRQLC